MGGIAIAPVDTVSTLDVLDGFLTCGGCHVINHVSADPIVMAQKDPQLRNALASADLNVADGKPVYWVARAANGKVGHLPGPDFMPQVIEWGLSRGLRHAFLGGTPQSLTALVGGFREQFPSLEVAGTYAPPFRPVTEVTVAEDLEALGETDILWVGLGTPKQQLWAHLARQHRPAALVFTVGAAFDFLSGGKSRAPRWMQRAGLEWSYRMASEPRRLWRRYLVGNARFIRLAGPDLLRARRGR